jgi:uncharacterized protein
MSILDDIAYSSRSLAQSMGLATPSLRLGVTGLSRAGKTVFITALVQALIGETRLPAFSVRADGRLKRAMLAPQPNDGIPRFAFEDHIEALTGPDRIWPQSTRRISELRVTLDYATRNRPLSGFLFGEDRQLHVDIVDYPGEWLNDLMLLEQNFAEWSTFTLALMREAPRDALSGAYLAKLSEVSIHKALNEKEATELSVLFTQFLKNCRNEVFSLSALPPGRFLMPGDLEGSPALTFAPLLLDEAGPAKGSLFEAFERRFEAYKSLVVEPFFRDHFARLDRQIVLVDVLTALNAGKAAVADLENALAQVLACFRVGNNTLWSSLFTPRIDRVLFAATKADHLNHIDHDRLEAILSVIVRRAIARVSSSGAKTEAIAMAAIRATREVEARQKGESFPSVAGVPLAGEKLADTVFDGTKETAIYPGSLPDRPEEALSGGLEGDLKFIRFRPPIAQRSVDGRLQGFPQIRLDRALEFLMGDRLT